MTRGGGRGVKIKGGRGSKNCDFGSDVLFELPLRSLLTVWRDISQKHVEKMNIGPGIDYYILHGRITLLFDVDLYHWAAKHCTDNRCFCLTSKRLKYHSALLIELLVPKLRSRPKILTTGEK